MSKPVTFIWPAVDTAAVSILQNRANAGPLRIDGTLATKDTSVGTVAVFDKLIRKVSLTSAGNLAGIVFTITGFSGNNNAAITTVINGPNANTIYTPELYTVVTSVSVSAGFAPNVSIGDGLVGSTFWYLSDSYRQVADMTVAVNVTANNITYTFETTLDDVGVVTNPFVWNAIDGVTIPTIPAGTDMIASSVDVIANYTFPAYYSRINIDGSDATGSLVAQFLQQGLK